MRDVKVQNLESGMQKLQSQLESLIQQLQPVFQGIGAVSRRVTAAKAQTPWPPEFKIHEQQQRKVPGDGDCLWHSLVACSLSPDALPAEVAAGRQFKNMLFQKIRMDPKFHADLWGCQAAGVLATVARMGNRMG